MSYPDSNPGGAGYAFARLMGIAGVLALLGGVGLGFYYFMMRPTAQSLTKLSVPGKSLVELGKEGTYHLYHDLTWSGPLRDLQPAVKSARTGRTLVIEDKSDNPESKWNDPGRYKRFASFVVEEPGPHEVTTNWKSRELIIGGIFLGAGYEPDLMVPLLIAVGGVLLIIAGLILALTIFSSRVRAAEATGQSLLYREKGIRVYPDFIFLKKKLSGTEIHKGQVNYVKQTTKYIKGHHSSTSTMPSVVYQGIKISYNQGGREREEIFRSEAYSKLYHAIKGAGFPTKWSPPGRGDED